MVGQRRHGPSAGWVVVDCMKRSSDDWVGQRCDEAGLALIEVAEHLDQQNFGETIRECLCSGFQALGSGDGELGEIGPSGVTAGPAMDDWWEGLQQWVVEFSVVREVATKQGRVWPRRSQANDAVIVDSIEQGLAVDRVIAGFATQPVGGPLRENNRLLNVSPLSTS
jgi:hypothetical protein